MSGTLSTLPAEICQMIFQQLFASTTVFIGFDDSYDESSSIDADGENSTDHSDSLDEHVSTEGSIPTNTSILRTCRRISIEAKPFMASNILLHIWSTKAMIDYLYKLSAEIIQSIRYITLMMCFPLPLYAQLHRNSFTTFDVSEAFRMFPGLQLDLLRVEDCYHLTGCYDRVFATPSNVGTYRAIDGLIRMDGWKELHFITGSTQFMSEPGGGFRERFPQPLGWNKIVLDRDGKDSAANVKMFVAKEPDVEGAAENRETRSEYEAIPGQCLEIEGDVHATPEERQKYLESREVLVVAKRGVSASYVQDGKQLHELLKGLLNRMNWEEVLSDNRYVDPEDDPTSCL